MDCILKQIMAPNIDIYNGEAPLGVEIDGKRALNGLKVAFGPELWWGANPAILLKYSKKIAGFDVSGIFHEDLDQRESAESSFAVPVPLTRRLTLHIKRKDWTCRYRNRRYLGRAAAGGQILPDR